MRKENLEQTAVAANIKEYVEKQRNYRNPALTGNDVAQALGISRTSLAKYAKMSFGTTLSKYIDKCRAKYARHSIIANKGQVDMERLALLSGFRTIRTLNKKYKEIYGELPSATTGKS